MPVLLQAVVIAAFVSGLFETSSARKAIAATDYRHFGDPDR
jgi:hypothetical protein